MRTRRNCLIFSGGILVLILCLVTAWGIGQWRYPQAYAPKLRSFSPPPNANLPLYIPVQVQVAAESETSTIAWLRFYVDGVLAGEQRGTEPALIGTWRWQPTLPGVHRLDFIAADEHGMHGMLSLPVIVLTAIDQDDDHIPDEVDACPLQPGAQNQQGCPIADDNDMDGISNAQDLCPEEAGLADLNGCPSAHQPDQDNDGVVDWDDRCPEEGGLAVWEGCPQQAFLTDRDADGVVDALDDCPSNPGAAENRGCPNQQHDDSDGDGVANAQDLCPNEAGSIHQDGCAIILDRDMDGIPDDVDACPQQPNPWGECAQAQAWTDADRDGVWDGIDDCDDQFGPIENRGCPIPGDQDGDQIPDEQDQCPTRPGPQAHSGCPPEREIVHESQPSVICRIFPELCPTPTPYTETAIIRESSPILCRLFPERCAEPSPIEESQSGAYPFDQDGDGVVDAWGSFTDRCPEQRGLSIHQGCPEDGNQDGIADADQDGDFIPDLKDGCINQPGMISNGGCPRSGEVQLMIYLFSINTLETFDNLYCYFHVQDSPWMRLPAEGGFTPSGVVNSADMGMTIQVAADGAVQFDFFCEAQRATNSPVVYLGSVQRSLGAEFWNGYRLYAISSSGDFLLVYRICENECR